MLARLKAEWDNYRAAPRWRQWLWFAVALLVAGYLAWCRWEVRRPAPGLVVTAAPPRSVANEPTKTVQSPVIVYRDRERVTAKLGMPPPAPREEVQAAADLPRLPYGGTAAVYLNASTGQSRVEVRAAESPWFALRRGNALGVSYGVGTNGQTAAVRYRRDIAQVKSVVISAEVEANYAQSRSSPVEAKAMVFGEWRW